MLVSIPHPKIEFWPLLNLSSTYAADSAFEVALLVFWPKSSNVNCKSKFSRIPFINAEIGPLPCEENWIILFL